ncbi:MAG: hypothetical protein IKC52_03690 [Clostridia bacterium]|nr:hypothetical protein [Clostridia bacterium]
MNNKIQSYIGFAIRKGSVVFGCDNIHVYRKKMYCILYTQNISQNSLKILKNKSQEIGCPLLAIDETPILTQRNCKAIAICDKSLATAISNNLK